MFAPGLVAALLLLATPRIAGAGEVEAISTAYVAAAPARVFELLTDFDAWEHVFSGIRVLRTEQLDAERARVRHLTRVIGRPLACTMAVTLRPALLQLDLVLDDREPHDLAQLASFWKVAPAPGGGSHVALRVVARSGFPIPAFVERRIVEQSARRSVDDLVRALTRVAALPALADH